MTDDDSKTLWCGNLAEQVTEEILYELFLQVGPLERVRIPRERDGRQKNFAFITYAHDISVPYAILLFRGTALFHRTLTLQCRARMPLLPPPIRCDTLDPSFDLSKSNVKQQFAEMAHNIIDEDHRSINAPKEFEGPNLVMASLQGNWMPPRHHPYERRNRDDRRYNRDDRDNNPDRSGHNSNQDWRETRNNNSRDGRYNNRRNYHRRD